MSAGVTAMNITYDNSAILETPNEAGLRYQGEWRMEAGLSSGPGVVDGEGEWSVASTAKSGAWVEFKGAGSAMYLYGGTGHEYGSVRIVFDGTGEEVTLDFTADFSGSRALSQLLYSRTDLGPSRETRLIMTNLEDKRMSLDYVILTVNQTQNPGQLEAIPFLSTLYAQLIVYLLVPLISLLAFGMLGFRLFRRYRRVGLLALERQRQDGAESAPAMHNRSGSSKVFGRHAAESSGTTIPTDTCLCYGDDRKCETGRTATPPVPPYHTYITPPDRQTESTAGDMSMPLRPIGRFFHRRSILTAGRNNGAADALSFSDMNYRDSALGTPSSAGEVGSARYLGWMSGTKHRSRLHQVERRHPFAASHAIPESTIPEPNGIGRAAHPFAQFRGISAPPRSSSCSLAMPDVDSQQLDAMSVIAAPPSVKDPAHNRSDLQSVHTSRSGRDFFPDSQLDELPVPDIPARAWSPVETRDERGRASRHRNRKSDSTAKLKRPPPAPLVFASIDTSSINHRSALRIAQSGDEGQVAVGSGTVGDRTAELDPSPARSESVFGLGPLGSPTVEAMSMSSRAEGRWRR